MLKCNFKVSGIITMCLTDAEQLVRQTGARVTTARVQVLAALLDARRALTHQEIAARLERGHGIDRVTVYRVLEWLTSEHLAHKISGDDRVWRFNAADTGHTGHHAHFKCNCCRRVFCLDDIAKNYLIKLPKGYRAQHLELTVKGLCAECIPVNKQHKLAADKKHPCNIAKLLPARGD